jgi:hypothetical protein
MAIRKQAFSEIGGFDEDFFFYSEEADFCYRLRKSGWQVLFEPRACVVHHRGGSSGLNPVNPKNIEMLIKSKILFCRKHLGQAETKFYIFCELNSSRFYYCFWQMAKPFLQGNLRKKADAKANLQRLFIDEWTRNRKQLYQ